MRPAPSLVLLLLLALLPWPARAGDATLDWRTIDTPNFQLHYPVGLEAVAFRAARLCEEAHRVLSPYFERRATQRVQVVLTDFGDSANGSASALPYPHINLFAAPPKLDGNLNDYDDWLRLLVFHEYVHILQLDQTRGLPALINALFGGIIAPNQNLPSFTLEGGAVWLESATSARGRIHSGIFRGFLRVHALAGTLYGIDAITHVPLTWPGANVWYMYGGHFIDWVARTRGEQAMGRMHDAMADDVIPFSLNRAMLEATGETFTALYEEWRLAQTARAEAERAALAAQGLTRVRALTTTGRRHANPRFLPDGTLWNIDTAGRVPSGIYARTPDTPVDDYDHRVVELYGTEGFDACRDGRRVVFDRNERYRGSYSFGDLFQYDRVADRTTRVTHGARLREPSCAPDGRWVAAAQIHAGRTRLVTIDLADGALTVLHDPGGLDQMAFPTPTPDGRAVVALRVSQTHGRDLVKVDRATGAVTLLTDDGALELHPRFSLDGRWLLWASDRTGVYQIHGRPWPDGEARQFTRVIGGALDPALSPDNQRLVWSGIVPEGYDLFEAPFAPEGIGRPPPPPAPPVRADAGEGPLPSRPYAPLETLWPVAWSPSFAVSSAEETASQLGIEVEAGDAVGHHSILGTFTTAPSEDALSVALSYSYRAIAPNLNLSLSHGTLTRQDAALYDATRHPFRERSTSGAVSLSLPFGRGGRGGSASIRYGLTQSQPAENPDPIHDPLDPAPRLPEAQRFGSVAAGFRFGDADSFAYAISTEQGRGFGVTVRLRHPNLGGDVESAELFWDYSEYIPLWRRHVLAFRLNGAFGRGDAGRPAFYALSPAPERNVLLDAIDGIFFGSTVLRGYPGGTVRGDRYVLATLEYRLPIADVFAGFGTVPFFFRRVKLAVFTDWAQGRTSTLRLWPDTFRRSAGAELLSEATLGWRLPMNVRLGYAHGIDDDGEGQLYFFLGSWY